MTQAVAIPDPWQRAIDGFKEQDAGQAYDLIMVRVRVGTSGAIRFITEDKRDTLTLTGIVMVMRKGRRFYIESLEATGGGQRPDCKSLDMKQGSLMRGFYENPSRTLGAEFGGDCATCPMNRWGTAEKGTGKRCKEMRYLAIDTEELGPCLLSLPPTSLKAVNLWATTAENMVDIVDMKDRTKDRVQYYCTQLVRVTLVEVSPKGSLPYSQAHFEFLRFFDEDERAEVIANRPLWTAYLDQQLAFGEELAEDDLMAGVEEEGDGGSVF